MKSIREKQQSSQWNNSLCTHPCYYALFVIVAVVKGTVNVDVKPTLPFIKIFFRVSE